MDTIPPKSTINAPLKEKLKLEKEKLREMNFKQKMEYLWEYYKLPFFGILIGVAIIAALINTWFFDTSPKTVFFIAWSTGYATEETLEGIVEILEDHLEIDRQSERVEISSFVSFDDNPTMIMANMSRMAAMVAVGDIDAFILDPLMVADYSEVQYLKPLDDVLAEIRLIDPVTYSLIEDRLIRTLHGPDEPGTEIRITGIDISSCPLFMEVGIFQEDLIFSVAVTSDNFDMVVGTIIRFFQ